VQQRHRRIVASGIMVCARKAKVPEQRKVSVVMAAYNEVSTVNEVVEAVLAKKVPGFDLELIIVESNSTDGTRERLLQYRDHPSVKLIFEDKPRGKGHAVRAGLAAVSGDYILIQDADLEYDLEDYDALLAPLMEGREAFVLGSRHNGSVWKMRQFAGQTGLSAFLNFGHCFFSTLVNVLFNQRLKDPFTMFKVFRRDCLFGLTFECDRFDFDFELLVKPLRKGYRPLEVPVNYRSRSFHAGKKVSVWRDPLTWLRALARLRVARIDPLAEIERQRIPAPDRVSAPEAAAERVFAV
jgi:glycosyltransferase involved in cell wall biosynthesis